MSTIRARRLARLREQMRRLEKPGGARGALSLCADAIDDALAAGGLASGCLHEIAAGLDDGAAFGFAASVLAQLAGWEGMALWCWAWRTQTVPYGPALARFGLTPGRVLFAEAHGPVEILWAMEEALRSG